MEGKAPNQVRVYGLASPTVLKEQEKAIEHAFLQALRITRAQDPVSVSETSGWIEYVDTRQLWRKGSSPQLPDRRTAAQLAEKFLRELVQALDPSKLPPALAGMQLVPRPRPVQVSLVPRPEGTSGDHWLYRAQPQLSLGGSDSKSIDVFGSQVEVRIGDGGRVISYHARWRPVLEEKVLTPLVPPPAADDGHTGHEHQVESQLVYLLEGDGIPQYYLSPYHFISEGHHLTLASACAYSLVVGLDVKSLNKGGTTQMTAVVAGGSGKYAFNWAVYTADDLWEQRIQELGGGISGSVETLDGRRIETSTVTVAGGAYVVLINIRDRKTGAFKHHQHQVCSLPILRERPPGLPLVA